MVASQPPAPLTTPETARLDYIIACAKDKRLGMIVTTRKSDNSRVVLLAAMYKSSDPDDPAPYHIFPVAEFLPLNEEISAYNDPSTFDTPDSPDDAQP